MIFGNINNYDTYSFLENDFYWRTCFSYLRQIDEQPDLGLHKIESSEVEANIMQYETRDRSDCIYESHLSNIDLQFTISGAENIDWQLSNKLIKRNKYDNSKDLQLYEDGKSDISLPMVKGNFVILFPSDAHRPQIKYENTSSVYKVVIKRKVSIDNKR